MSDNTPLNHSMESQHSIGSSSPTKVPDLYAPIDCACEDVEQYRPGGFHPLVIDDRILDRYHIIHKLGVGGSATVWLARDEHHERYVALKVLTASWTADSGARELAAYKHLNAKLPAEQRDFIVPLYDSFELEGPNGKHLCLSLGLSGPSLSSVVSTEASMKLRPDIAQSLARQLTDGLNRIHQTGIVYHDFSPNNVLLQLTENVQRLSIPEMYELLGHPEACEVQPREGNEEHAKTHAPSHVYPSVGFTTPEALHFVQPAIKLIDFAEVRYVDEAETEAKHGVTLQYVDPETLFWREKPTQASDIWSLACILFELRGNDTLIPSGYGENDLKNGMIDCIGPLPEAWRKKNLEEAEVDAVEIVDADEFVQPTTWVFDDVDFGNIEEQLARLDAKDASDKRKSWAPARVLSVMEKLKRAVKSLFRNRRWSVVPERRLIVPYITHEGFPQTSMSLEETVRNIGTWTPWCHMSVEERMEKLLVMHQSLGDVDVGVRREDCDTGEPPHKPLSAEEARDFVELLAMMLTWRRDERASLEAVLNHRWFSTDYGCGTDAPWVQKYHRGYQYFVNGEQWV